MENGKRTISSELTNFTVLPFAAMERVKAYLDYNKIEYVLMNEPEFLDFAEPSCKFMGRVYLDHVKCFATKMPSEELINIAEKLYRQPVEKIIAGEYII